MLRALLVAPLLTVALAAPAAAADAPPAQELQVETLLPPGGSGFVSLAGQAQGAVTGDYGPHLDDQRELYWRGQGGKPGAFLDVSGLVPEQPRPGVRVYRDEEYGVPAVYGDTGADVWWGAGWAAGQDRLFLADAVRRMGRGTFAELTGPSGVPLDVQTRTLTYSDAEYAAMLAALPASSREAIEAYAAGMYAWISHVRVTPADLPAEYALLQTLPEPWTVTDTLAAGVLLTRTVATAGGTEMQTVAQLRALQAALGAEEGLAAFEDLTWQQDERAAVTVPAEEGRFDSAVVPADRRDAVLRESAAYALALDPALAAGPGTGAAPEPGLPVAAQDAVTAVTAGLTAWARGLHGGSYAFAVAPERTTTGEAMLVSGPQLGYSYPSLLWEVEVHGGGYDARGSTVPGLPTVGIGYGERVAWGLTTGYSKTIDSFVETTRRTGGALEYLHDGVWKPADCRTEAVRYRQAVEGVPVGPPVFSQDVEVCRTVHGPVVAEAGDRARSVQYAMSGRELETVTGILQWNRADTLEEFEQGVRQVTWNENVTYADADGHIGYWHSGLHLRRSPGWDSRFPAPGTGEHDTRGLLSFEEVPHSVDPEVGYLANWNNKPAVGWQDDFLDPASGRPSGPESRVATIQRLLAAQPRLSPEALTATEYRLGVLDHRSEALLPLLAQVAPADARQADALALLAGWDGTTYGPGAGTSTDDLDDETATDGPAPTLFRAFADALRDEVLRDLPAAQVVAADTVGSHLYDATPADNLVLRVLDPSSSSLVPRRDHLAGTRDDALRAALDLALDRLTAAYGADPAGWREVHPRSEIASLSGVIGPSTTMPFQDRGSWVHVVAFTGAGAGGGPAGGPSTPPVAAAPGRGGGTLAATGAAPLAPALVLLGGGLLLRRRRRA